MSRRPAPANPAQTSLVEPPQVTWTGDESAMSSVMALTEAIEGTSLQARLDAIAALARAPREDALPVLVQVAQLATAEDERHAALGSLHTLAADQGDDDDRIHQLLRDLVYDGDDEAVTANAAAVLDGLDQANSAAMRPIVQKPATPPMP